MNQGQFSGYLGRDAEMRNAGTHKVLNFSVGVSTGFGDRKKTLWIGCAMWGERGEKLAQYLKKGTAVSVSGEVDLRMYESNGEARAELTLNVQQVTLMGSKGERVAPASATDGAPAAAGVGPGTADPHGFADDVPF